MRRPAIVGRTKLVQPDHGCAARRALRRNRTPYSTQANDGHIEGHV
jgi:hypothetical protein